MATGPFRYKINKIKEIVECRSERRTRRNCTRGSPEMVESLAS